MPRKEVAAPNPRTFDVLRAGLYWSAQIFALLAPAAPHLHGHLAWGIAPLTHLSWGFAARILQPALLTVSTPLSASRPWPTKGYLRAVLSELFGIEHFCGLCKSDSIAGLRPECTSGDVAIHDLILANLAVR